MLQTFCEPRKGTVKLPPAGSAAPSPGPPAAPDASKALSEKNIPRHQKDP